jgi:selenocysteine-specific elongation factor
LDVEDIRRGDVLAAPGRYRPTQRVDVHFRLLPDADGPLKHAAEVKFFVGASEVLARVRLLGTEELIPGDDGWLQLDLQQPIVTVRGDRYILRRPSPAETLGGGMLVDPHPARRHRRFSNDVLKKLEALRYGSPADVLFQAALASGLAPLKEITNRARLSGDQIEPALDELIDSGQLIQIEAGKPTPNAELLVCARPVWTALAERAIGEVRGYHQAYPLRLGMPREELKSRLKLPSKAFQIALRHIINQGQLAERGTLIQIPDHELRFSAQQQAAIDRLMARFAQAPYTPPSVKEAQVEVGEDVVSALIELGQLVQVSPEVVFRKQDYQALTQWVEQHFQNQAELTVAQFRDEFNTSRRYALGFLEHLDALGVTIRSGDARRLHKMSSNR